MDLDNLLIANHPGCFLYANGGQAEGSVYVGTNRFDQDAEIKITNAIDHTDGKPTTVFTGDVYCAGDIRGGSFYGSVTAAISDNYLNWDITKNFWSNICGGNFYKPVRTEGYVSGGTFYDGLTLEKNAKLSGKPMNTGTEINDKTNIPDPNGKPVTVTYEYGKLDGIYAEQIVQAGEKAKTPADPTKTGYTFAGWELGGNAYDFAASVTEDMTLTAKWTVCDHTGSTAKPTCTDSAVCTVCGGTIPEKGHALIWQSENGEYWQKCSNCDFETEKKLIPVLTLNAPDKVCRTQDCTFTFNLPDGCTNPEFGYEFTQIGSGSPAIVDNGVCNGTVEAVWYDEAEASFKLTVYATTADGFLISTSKNIEIVDGHTYEWQSESGEYWQKCKLCGNETTKKPIPEIVISGADRVCRTQDYIFGFTLPEGCKLITTGYEFERIGGDISATLENGKYTVDLTSSGYPVEENSFKVTVYAETADGFAIKAEKIVTIQNDHTGGKATCKDKAKCEVCGAEYGEIDAKNHTNLKHFPAKAATKTTEGNIEYWYCDGCGKYYSGKDGTKKIKKADTVTTKLKDDSKSPQTGDNFNLALWLSLLLVSGGAAIGTTVVSRKKKYNR